MLRVTADTNIFVSGLDFHGGKPFQFLELARAGKINLMVSEAILSEVADVLSRKFDGVWNARRPLLTRCVGYKISGPNDSATRHE